jgi:hypothetical protein
MNAWNDILKQAVIGTGRGGFTPPELTNGLATLLQEQQALPAEDRLLSMAAGLTHYHRLGARSATVNVDAVERHGSDSGYDPSPPLPLASTAIADRLRGFLRTNSHELVTESVSLLATHDLQAPYDVLPNLLELADGIPELAEPLTRCMGDRGCWLIDQHEPWQHLAIHTDPEAVWLHGRPKARLRLLQRLRRDAPPQALVLMQKTWRQETAKDRTAFVAQLRHGLSADDTHFLMGCLDDRSLTVRTEAARLLVRLDNNEVIETAQSIVAEHLRVNRSLLRKKLQITLPGQFQRDWGRYGIREKPPTHLKMSTPLWWLHQWLGLCAPSRIAQFLGADPSTLIQWLARHDYKRELVPALREGAANGADVDFVSQDLANAGPKQFPERFADYAHRLPSALLQNALLYHIAQHRRQAFGTWHKLLVVVNACGPLSASVTEALCRHVFPSLAKSLNAHSYLAREIGRLGLLLDVDCYERVYPQLEQTLEPDSHESAHTLLKHYTSRSSLHKEFAQD